MVKALLNLSVIPISIMCMMWGWGLTVESWGWIAFSYLWIILVGIFTVPRI